jgi:hypothetical protein
MDIYILNLDEFKKKKKNQVFFGDQKVEILIL